eukprot:jgi/Hompol1/5298/HPOL_000937-RA
MFSSSAAQSSGDLNLSKKEQEKLERLVQAEQQKAAFQAQVREYSEIVTCVANCVERFIDSTFVLLKAMGASPVEE